MPVIFDNDILIPPSMRSNRAPPRRYYGSTTIIEPSNTFTTTIELPPHRPEVATPPRSPLIIHREETTRIMPSRREIDEADDSCSCCSADFDYDFEAGGKGGRRYYAESSANIPPVGVPRLRSLSLEAPPGTIATVRAGRLAAGHEYDRGYRRGRRDSKFDAAEGDYYMEDGSRHSNYYLADVHHGPHVLPLHNHYDAPGYNESRKHHNRAKRLAQAGLTVAALGAAKELHDHRRGRSRSTSSSRSRSRGPSHNGRKIAAAALGATAAGVAAHKFREHRQRPRSRSVESHTSSSDGEHHGKAKLAAATAAATAATIGGAALAAHHIRKRRESRSRSRSRSRSSSRERGHGHAGRHIAAAALGGTAAGLAHHHYKHHPRGGRPRPRPALRRSHSESSFHGHGRRGLLHRHRPVSPHKHSRLKKGAALAAAAVVAKEALEHYRDRSRSRASSRSRSRSRSHGRHPYSRHQSRHSSRPSSPHHHRGGLGHQIVNAIQDHSHRVRSRVGSVSEGSRPHGGGVQVPATDGHRHAYASPTRPYSPYPPSSASCSCLDDDDGYVEMLSSSSSDWDSDVDTGDGRRFGRSRSVSRRRSASSAGARAAHETGIGNSVVEDRTEQDDKKEENRERRRLGDGLDPEGIAHKVRQALAGHDK